MENGLPAYCFYGMGKSAQKMSQIFQNDPPADGFVQIFKRDLTRIIPSPHRPCLQVNIDFTDSELFQSPLHPQGSQAANHPGDDQFEIVPGRALGFFNHLNLWGYPKISPVPL